MLVLVFVGLCIGLDFLFVFGSFAIVYGCENVLCCISMCGLVGVLRYFWLLMFFDFGVCWLFVFAHVDLCWYFFV